MPPKAAHYIWSYFHGMSSALYWNMGEFAHIPSKGLARTKKLPYDVIICDNFWIHNLYNPYFRHGPHDSITFPIFIDILCDFQCISNNPYEFCFEIIRAVLVKSITLAFNTTMNIHICFYSNSFKRFCFNFF